ncbi:hypothetical protein [Desulforamulus reducens]|uniref:hypothetical protein n=1 Tax=Desulforamulus reducens TaxID=59610 RepID=UPI0002E07318|nr:hypothetical protein [Desulforamulus reducens]
MSGVGYNGFFSRSMLMRAGVVYTGLTEPVPLGAVKARVQFTKAVSDLVLIKIHKWYWEYNGGF